MRLPLKQNRPNSVTVSRHPRHLSCYGRIHPNSSISTEEADSKSPSTNGGYKAPKGSSRLSVLHFHRFRIPVVSGERPRCLTSAKDSHRYDAYMPSGSRMNSIILFAERTASNLIMASPSQNASVVKIILTCQQEALDLQHPPTHQAR